MDLERYRGVIADFPAFLEAASRPEPTVFRVRAGRVEPERLLERLGQKGFRVRTVDGLPGFFQVESGPYPISLTLEHWHGLLYLQQASTGVAPSVVAPRPGERVLDLCAAPGGKTTHLAELMEDRGCLVASEISESRIRGLLGNVYRLAHTNVLVVAGDGREFPEGALFDRVLVDAPCSGEGTLRRRSGDVPDTSPRFRAFVEHAQRGLLERAVRLTRPGGVITYVTCTFAPEENEAVVSDALQRLPVALEPLELDVPHAPGLTAFEGLRFDPRVEGAARIYPHHLDSGGLFLARLRRLDGDDGGPSTGRAAGEGWSRPAVGFPGEPVDDAEVSDLSTALPELGDRWRLEGALERAGWTLRGGRAWLHTVDEWPLPAWEPGRWRAISLGLRAIEWDSARRPRPTNDLLRWAGVGARRVAIERGALAELLEGSEPASTDAEPGPVALDLEGDVLGRGTVAGGRLRSEIPKARAADLLRALRAEASPAGED